MDTVAADFDGAWKYALEHYFPDFLSLFFPDMHEAIDWDRPWVVRDTELQQIAPEDQAGKQRVDYLVEVHRHNGNQALVLIHLEVQSQPDEDFGQRMFFYYARLFDRERIPIVSLAILGDDNPHWRPDGFAYSLWGCELNLRFPTIKLLDLDRSMLEASANPFAMLTLLHRDAQETRGQPEERLRRKAMRYRTLFHHGYRADDIRRLLRLIEQLLRLSPDMHERSHLLMRQVEQEETGMDTFITSIEEVGHARGLAEGRLEGLAEGRHELLIRLLDRKLGPLSMALRNQIRSLAPEASLRLSDVLLDFVALDDLLSWLQNDGLHE